MPRKKHCRVLAVRRYFNSVTCFAGIHEDKQMTIINRKSGNTEVAKR